MITIGDTGILVAFLNRRDPHHRWAVDQLTRVQAPVLVCEAVLTEAACFLREDGLTVEPLFQLLESGALRLDFSGSAHWPRLRILMARYKQMDLADACVVAMTELHSRCQVLTLDRKDFTVYRRNDRQVIDFIAPARG